MKGVINIPRRIEKESIEDTYKHFCNIRETVRLLDLDIYQKINWGNIENILLSMIEFKNQVIENNKMSKLFIVCLVAFYILMIILGTVFVFLANRAEGEINILIGML